MAAPDRDGLVVEDGRVAAYIDGFNMYFGMMAKGYRKLRWLDYRALIERKLRKGAELVEVNFFTAEVQMPPDKRERQQTYLRALEARGGVTVHRGQYRLVNCYCESCADYHRKPLEKESDVALSLAMAFDAADDRYDTAFLVCGDSDQIPTVKLVRQRFAKRVVLWSPPRRSAPALADVTDADLHFTKQDFKASQLPNPVMTKKDKAIWCPDRWKE